MARIRSIHPGLLTDEAFMALTVDAPLAIALYLGLLMESDDEGIFEMKPMTIKARILPAVSADVVGLIDILVAHRFIALYEVDGRKLGAVRNFCRYQRPKKPHAVLPKTAFITAWVGLATGPEQNQSSPSSEPVPHQSDTSPEKSPQMEDGGWRMEDGVGDAAAAARDPVDPRKAFERRCREAVGQEPVCCAQDFHVIEALIDSGMTEADVMAGIVEGLEKADREFRFRDWRNFRGWIRTAAKNRLAGKPRNLTKAPPAKPPDNPDDPVLEFPGGFRRPTSFVLKAIERWRVNPRSWPLAELSAPPDSPTCRVPPQLLQKAGIAVGEHAA